MRDSELVTFVGVQFRSSRDLLDDAHGAGSPASCASQACAALMWIAQVRELAAGISRISGGQRSSVHLYTSCLASTNAEALFSAKRNPRVVISSHRSHHPALRQALLRMRAWAQRSTVSGSLELWRSSSLLTLLKWSAVAAVHARIVVVLDIDVEPLPRPMPSVPSAWLALLRCVLRSDERFFSLADHSAPVNAAVMLLKPSLALFSEGLAALRPGGFNRSHGWAARGPPRLAVPRSDAAWRQPKLRSTLASGWDFVGASIDQGFFFAMHRVRHQHGADLSADRGQSTPPHQCSARRRGAPYAPLRHYAGGCKPEMCLREAVACDPREGAGRRSGRRGHAMRPPSPLIQRLLGTSLHSSSHFDALDVARTLWWGRRARRSLHRMMRALPAGCGRYVASRSHARAVRGHAFDEAVADTCARLRACSEFLANGIGCIVESLDEHNVSALRVRAVLGLQAEVEQGPMRASTLLNLVVSSDFDRAMPTAPIL
jgi:hypothetical protein